MNLNRIFFCHPRNRKPTFSEYLFNAILIKLAIINKNFYFLDIRKILSKYIILINIV